MQLIYDWKQVSDTHEMNVMFYYITETENSDEILWNIFFDPSEEFLLCVWRMAKLYADRVHVFNVTKPVWSVNLSADAHE